MPVEEEKAEKDAVEHRARRLERSAAEGPSGEGGGVGVGEERRFCDACDAGGEGARQGREGGGRGARRMKTRERKRPDTSSVTSKAKATR